MDYIGIDVHKDFCVQTTINEKGEIKLQSTFLNEREYIERFAEIIGDGKVVLESSTFSLPIYYQLKEKQIDVILAHPAKVRWIAEARIKTDVSDSEKLAKLLKADLIPQSYAPSPEARDNRNMVRHRDSLVKMRTSIKNNIHAILAKETIKHGQRDLFNRKGICFLRSLALSATAQYHLDSNLVLLKELDTQINEFEKRIKQKVEENKLATMLTTIPGIADISALAIMSEIDTIKRFPDHGRLASYFGIVPSRHQSGKTDRVGHIHKQGSKLLRQLLVQDANAAIKVSKKVRRFYTKIKKKKGHNVAIIAAARKLIKYVFWVLTNEREFVYEKR